MREHGDQVADSKQIFVFLRYGKCNPVGSYLFSPLKFADGIAPNRIRF